MMDRKTAEMLADVLGERMRKELEFQADAIRRAFLDLPRLLNVGQANRLNRGIEGHDILVGSTETEPFLSRARSLSGREEIFLLTLHATQSLFLGKTRGIAAGNDPGRIPIGSAEVLQILTIPWPSSQDVWLFGSGAGTTGLLIELRRGGR